MHYHIILTKECNLNCSYCGGGSNSPPKEIQYPISYLMSFLSKDEAAVIEFYGGEPLLRMETMKEIMDSIPSPYVMQTNGIFLNKLEPEYLKKFHSILVSVDGKKEVTNSNRGSGVYERIVRNIETIRKKGFRGDLVARMTVTKGNDIFENVLHLLPFFDHVHWQLNFEMFWEGAEPIEEWINQYNEGISSLVRWWVSEMHNGRIHGIVPFLCVTNTLLSDTKAQLRCGSGIDFFTIMPDGRISACPVSIDFDFSVIGSIYEDAPKSLCNKVSVGEPCTSCDIFHICGGRCPFVNRAQDMLRENGYYLICSTVRHLVNELQAAVPEVRELIEKGIISGQDFEYPEINNGCEIIP